MRTFDSKLEAAKHLRSKLTALTDIAAKAQLEALVYLMNMAALELTQVISKGGIKKSKENGGPFGRKR